MGILILSANASRPAESISSKDSPEKCEKDSSGGVASTSGGVLSASFSTSGRLVLSRHSSPRLRRGPWFLTIAVDDDGIQNGTRQRRRFDVSVERRRADPLVAVLAFYLSVSVGATLFLTWLLWWIFDDQKFTEESRCENQVDANELESNADRFDVDDDENDVNVNGHSVNSIVNDEDNEIRSTSSLSHKFLARVGRRLLSVTHPVIVLVVGVVVSVPAIYISHRGISCRLKTGDQDFCYFNEKCFYPGLWSISFGRLFSNASYLVTGVALTLIALWHRARCRRHEGGEENLVRVDSFHGPTLAAGLALIMTGVFSFIYHLCPSKRAVDFDRVFPLHVLGLFATSLLRRISRESIHFDLSPPSLDYFVIIFPGQIVVLLGSIDERYPLFVISCCVFVVWVLLLLLLRRWTGKCPLFHIIGIIVFFFFLILVFVLTLKAYKALFAAYVSASLCLLICIECIECKRGPLCCRERLRRILGYAAILALVLVSLYLFVSMTTIKNSGKPWESRAANRNCLVWQLALGPHDAWHFFTSLGLYAVALRIHMIYAPCGRCRRRCGFCNRR